MRIAYISMNNRWRVGVEVLEAFGNVKHEGSSISILPISVVYTGGELTSRFSVGQSTFR
jgi:hypothetical protein